LSGILAYGDQRAAAVSDFDRDGRLDLVLTQNSAQTRLFRNTSAKPGLRIRLKGSPLNPTAVGAAIRIESADGLGPIREVQAGSGYWSQNSPVQIMSTSSSPIAIHVRWPDGKSTSTPYPTAALEIEIDPSGLARVPRNPSQP
jgi:hypothetical protein